MPIQLASMSPSQAAPALKGSGFLLPLLPPAYTEYPALRGGRQTRRTKESQPAKESSAGWRMVLVLGSAGRVIALKDAAKDAKDRLRELQDKLDMTDNKSARSRLEAQIRRVLQQFPRRYHGAKGSL